MLSIALDIFSLHKTKYQYYNPVSRACRGKTLALFKLLHIMIRNANRPIPILGRSSFERRLWTSKAAPQVLHTILINERNHTFRGLEATICSKYIQGCVKDKSSIWMLDLSTSDILLQRSSVHRDPIKYGSTEAIVSTLTTISEVCPQSWFTRFTLGAVSKQPPRQRRGDLSSWHTQPENVAFAIVKVLATPNSLWAWKARCNSSLSK